MADSILSELNAANLFDLRGVVAVVTGGGTVRAISVSVSMIEMWLTLWKGHWDDDQFYPRCEWRDCLYHWTKSSKS